MYIEFVGDFKQLKELGYEFSKLFMRNHICYHKEEVWIWKKGKKVEIVDCYGNSYLLLQELIRHDFYFADPLHTIVINRETKQVESYEAERHEGYYLPKDMPEEERRAFYKRYKKIMLEDETIQTLKHLYEQKMICITESEES